MDERKETTQDGKKVEYCRRVRLGDEKSKNVRTIDDVRENELDEIQIQRMDIRSYSSNTKLFLIPSMPFEMTFNDAKFYIYRMTLYHPCPVRIENVQYDAVLSLNDPSDTNATHIVLIPLKGVSIGAGESGRFISKIAAYIPAIVQPDASGEYPATDVPTNADWSITKLLNVDANPCGEIEVKNAFFQWIGRPSFDRYTKNIDRQGSVQTNKVGWRPDQSRNGPTYILMKDPALVSAFDLATIRMLPVTPPEEAIHPIPKVFTYKAGVCKDSAKVKEKFTMPKEECDPLALLSKQQTQTMDSQTMINIILGILSGVAVFIGIYFAMKYATGPIGNLFKTLGEKIGRAVSGVDKALAKAKLPLPKPTTPPPDEKKQIEKVEPDETAFTTVNPMRLSQQQKKQIEKVEPKTQRSLQGYRNPRLQTQRRIPESKPKPEPMEFETVNPMKLTQEEKKEIEKAMPPPPEPIQPPTDIRKTQRTLQGYKSPALRSKTMKNRPSVKTSEADKEDVAKLEQEIKDVAGTGLLTPEEMKIPPEQRKLFNGKVVKRRIIAEETPDEDIQQVKELIAEKKEAEKKLEQDKQKGFMERLADDRAKVEQVDQQIKKNRSSINEAVQRMKDRRRKTTRAILEESKRMKTATETKPDATKLFGPLPKGQTYPIGYRGKTQ